MKRFSIGIMVLWAAGCLAQPIYKRDFPSLLPPRRFRQQTQAKDLRASAGKTGGPDFTGSFGYAIPIHCAPARNGSEPGLALVYSSKGESGWCGVGWKLDIGCIERNTQNGIPIAYSATTQCP